MAPPCRQSEALAPAGSHSVSVISLGGRERVSQTVNKASLALTASLAVSCVYTKEVNQQRTVESPGRIPFPFGLPTTVVQIKFSQFEPSSRLLLCKKPTRCKVV